jgi:NTE family protein
MRARTLLDGRSFRSRESPMKFRHLASIMLLSVFYSIPLPAQYDDGRIEVGLVLSGGGARGGAHVGVLKVLEALNLQVDYIVGTSMGAIIGGFYAAGYSADEIERLLVEVDWNRALTDQPDRADRTMRGGSRRRWASSKDSTWTSCSSASCCR